MQMRKILKRMASPRMIATGIRDPNEVFHYLRSVRHRHPDPPTRAQRLQREYNEATSFETLAAILGTDTQSLHTHVNEFTTEVKPHVDECRTEFESKPFEIGGIEVEAPILYATLRVCQPERVVEVGVANGVSSYYILSALDANDDSGTLTSIDLPKYEDDHTGEWDADAGAWIPSGRDVGWIVPDEYRYRWDVQIGSMSVLLPDELSANDVDAFVYDGPKRYSERKRTFDMVADSVEECLYFCDDIAWNPSFERWADQNRLQWDTFGNAGLAVDGKI